MKQANPFESFKNLYSLSKTLRFELIPQGRTLEHIENKGLLVQDENRAKSYQKVKKIIDEFHKDFIEKSLKDSKLSKEILDEYFQYYNIRQRDETQKMKFEELQTKLRKEITEQFKNLKELESADLYNPSKKEKRTEGKLNSWLKDNTSIKEKVIKDLKLPNDYNFEDDLKRFESFATYFNGFHENRKNMYTEKEHSTGIAYRLIHDNLPKFIDNISSFEKVKNTAVKNKFSELYENFKEYLYVSSIEEIFSLDYYSRVLTQPQIDVYNLILGGKSEEQGKIKIQGLNEYINLYNQTQTDKNLKLPKLKPLFKQILSDRNALSWLPEAFEDDNQVLESIEKAYQDLIENVICKNNEGERNLIQVLQSLNEFDLSKIYLKNDASLTDISQQCFGSWIMIQKAVEKKYESENLRKKNETEEGFAGRKSKFFKHHDSFSIGYLNECLELLGDIEKDGKICTKNLADYFANLGQKDEVANLFSQIEANYKSIETLLNTDYPEKERLAQNKGDVEKIKLFLDSIKALQWFVKPLLGKGNEAEKDEKFYGELSELYKPLDEFTNLYNKVRNYMTQKPYSEEKMRLFFENSTLLDGWDVNKESDNTSIILRKNGLYYLGIMDKKHNKILKHSFVDDGHCFEKMEYKLLPGANKMLPKVFFSSKGIQVFKPHEAIIENYKNETHKKGDAFNIQDCHNLIDFFKTSINKHKDWTFFDFKFSDTKNYQDLSGFYREVEAQGYKMTFRNIPEKAINNLVEEGKLYLFQIYNKDFSPHSKGIPNMHTLYWKMLFDAENLKNVVYKLNGQAEMFFRKASIKNDIIIHRANEAIKNKNELNAKKESLFHYDLIKNKRYTLDKFQFHVPITMNFKAKGSENITPIVNQYLKKNAENTYIIGIDRGERHLLYLSLINPQGEIVKQFSLNEIVNEYKGSPYRTNYHRLLDERGDGRDKARKSWQTIETIKELKEGYLSQVIHKITELMLEYNAIVVLEDLNFGFMRGRQKVEKQVYQKFEKMLIDKLNYLVDKKKAPTELGGTLNALQLSNKFESFQKMGKQSGFLFYVPAWNTSKICPVTGFVNLFDTRYENVEKAKAFFGKFDAIRFNPVKKYFEFEVNDYTKFSPKAEGTIVDWTICSHSTRIETFKNPEKNHQWDHKEFDLTNEFAKLLKTQEGDLKALILAQTEKSFFERLLHLFKMTVQMRNSITNSDIDYLISPVADKNGVFYDSRNYEKQENPPLPKDADANGAYNIARKGQILIKRLVDKGVEAFEKSKKTEKGKPSEWLSNKEWLQFAQNQELK